MARSPAPSHLRWHIPFAAWLVLAACWCAADEPVAIRIENFTVPPATGPLAFVTVKNLLDEPYVGSVSLAAPQRWRIAPAAREVRLPPGQVARVAFTVEQARATVDNSYPCEARATGHGTTVVHRRDVVVASAPYFKPVIDGDPADWQDAIPVTFLTSGKQTVVRTFWNRRSFSLLVAVEEDHLSGPPAGEAPAVDAVQFSLAPAGSLAAATPTDTAGRFEFLLLPGHGEHPAACYLLAEPTTPLRSTQDAGPLARRKVDDAAVAVSRTDTVTYYECSVPFRPMSDALRPSEGREFFFGLLVHDPDGTGIRDLAAAAGLWPSQRDAEAWIRWPGSRWPEPPPRDGKVRWGMCSSKY